MVHTKIELSAPSAPRTGPTRAILPQAGDPEPRFAGFGFITGAMPPHEPGIFVLTRQIGALLYPVLIGEAEDIAAALQDFRLQDPTGAREVDGQFWSLRAQPRQRAYVARDLIGKFHPPRNIEHRKAPAPPEIAMLVPDRAGMTPSEDAPPPPVGHIAATEEELSRLVEAFYAAAKADPLIGPVFNRGVGDWERHTKVVENFWSRSLLGTTRYTGNPFSAHLSLGLQPEHFARWVALFKTTATAVLRPEAAASAIGKVEHMARCFQTGLFLPPIEERSAAPRADRM